MSTQPLAGHDSPPWADADGHRAFPGGAIVQLVAGRSIDDAVVTPLAPATVRVTDAGVTASVDGRTWSWLVDDLDAVWHGGAEPWTILAVPGVPDHGVAVEAADASRFRELLDALVPSGLVLRRDSHLDLTPAPSPSQARTPAAGSRDAEAATEPDVPTVPLPTADDPTSATGIGDLAVSTLSVRDLGPSPALPGDEPGGNRWAPGSGEQQSALAGLDANSISAWFGTHHVLDRVSLRMAAGEVTALIGPSGCGKSTFLRILNRMHEMIPGASLAGEVLLAGEDIYDPSRKLTDARRQIGMVFQKPNPFPAMSIYDNVVASFRLTGTKVSASDKDDVVETCLRKAGLWNEVRDRLRAPGGGLSGGQQQRLCIARALAIRPRVLLMDEPCSALDPTSTRRIEQTIAELASEVTIVIVTHNMQQAARVSHRCAFFLAEQGTPGVIVEHGPTDAMFHAPQDPRTNDYVNGRFG